MNNNVCIAIGVSECGSLHKLDGAINGARQFAQWAEENGYDAHRFIDGGGAKVLVKPIADLIEAIIDDGDVKRLVVYFAGHGSLGHAGADCWLLSDVETDAGEAINLNVSTLNAAKSQLKQIAFIADACRNRIADADGILGTSIFPRRPSVQGQSPSWDKFYACKLGEASQEVPNEDPVKAYGIFSKCLMKALLGEAEDAIEEIVQPRGAHAVTSDALARYLKNAVISESSSTRGAAVQFPELHPGWMRPDDVYRLFAETGTRGQGPIGTVFHYGGDIVFGHGIPTETPLPAEIQRRERERATERKQLARHFFTEPGHSRFDIRQGLTIRGARPLRVAGTGPHGLIEENGAWHVRGDHDGPQSVLIELEDRRWIGAAIYPELVGTIEVGGGVESLVYRPSEHGMFEFEGLDFERLAEASRSWTALMHLGHQAPKQDLIDLSDELRQYKHANPSLAIMAAHAYMRAGELAKITSMAWYCQERDQPVPFDVAYLAGVDLEWRGDAFHACFFGADGAGDFEAPVVGLFPLMTETWSFIDPKDTSLPDAVHQAFAGVLPSLWTLLSPAAGEKFALWLEGN